jgi:polyphenol oxidase
MSVKHHFFGKDCIIDRALLNRQNILQDLKNKGFEFDNLLFVNQIHSAEVVVVDDKSKIHDVQNLPKADAIVTNISNVAIAVVTADCAPIFLFDEEVPVIAVVHAGWRGAKSGVIQKAILEMKNLGAKNIKAEIGPMIQQESYEVSQEFFDDFLLEKKDNQKFFKTTLKSGHYLFDLPAYVVEKMSEAQIFKVNNLGIDTYKNEEMFFSFRRSTHRLEKDCGRNVSVIVIN